MNVFKTISSAALFVGVLACSQTAFAQGRVFADETTTANLSMTAEAQTVLNLDISTHASGADVTGTLGSGAFSIDLGNVNGLGIGTPATNVTKAVTGAGATYTTPITLTPTFSGFSSTDAVIAVSNDGDATAREGVDAASVTGLSASLVNVTSTATTGAGFTRYVGFFVSNENGTGNVSGAMASTITYTITATP